MTVYELIQELARYDASAEVKFHAEFEHTTDAEAEFDRDNEDDVQEVAVDVRFDGDLNLDGIKTKTRFCDEVVLELYY